MDKSKEPQLMSKKTGKRKGKEVETQDWMQFGLFRAKQPQFLETIMSINKKQRRYRVDNKLDGTYIKENR